jgi:hypothetical protein
MCNDQKDETIAVQALESRVHYLIIIIDENQRTNKKKERKKERKMELRNTRNREEENKPRALL